MWLVRAYEKGGACGGAIRVRSIRKPSLPDGDNYQNSSNTTLRNRVLLTSTAGYAVFKARASIKLVVGTAFGCSHRL
jgi:hypothetical protein